MKRNLKNIVETLTEEQKLQLITLLKTSLASILSKQVTTCPCCAGTNFVKNGYYKDTQKYKCKTTGNIFNHKTDTVATDIREIEKFEQLINWLGEGSLPTLRQITHRLEVSHQTAHEWRSKILSALYMNANFSTQVIEFDEIYHRLSRKGRRGLDPRYVRKNGNYRSKTGDNPFNDKVFITYSRTTGKLDIFQSHMGRTKESHVKQYLEVNKEMVVYSDKHPSYAKFFKQNAIEYYTFKAKDHVDPKNKKAHVQTVNAYSNVFTNLINVKHRGVSTKFLQNYCNWVSFLVAAKSGVSVAEMVMNNRAALAIHKQKEKEFQMWLKNNGRSNYGRCQEHYKLAA